MNAIATKSNVMSKVDRSLDQQPKKMNKGKSLLLAAATAVASLLGALGGNNANAVPTTYTLQNGNSTSTVINPDGTVTLQNGMQSWIIDGVNQINQQWFSYRVGNSGPSSQLDQLTPVGTPTQLSTDGTTNNFLQLKYAGTGFAASVTYLLSGGQSGSKTADMSEIVKITNTSSSNLTFSLFQYSEFSLGGSAGNGETVSITGNNTATVNSTSNFTLSQTVVSPHASEDQASSVADSDPGSLENELLNTPGFTTLNDNGTAPANPGVDSAWALEWDITLAPGATLQVSEDNVIKSVPEPTTGVALLSLGGLFLMRSRRRDEDPDPRTAQVAEA